MKLLMVASYLPFPLHSGGHIRLYNLIKELAKSHTITLICEQRNSQTQQDIDEVKKICKEVITVRRIPQWSLANIVKTAISKYPFLLVGHTNAALRLAIQKKLREGRFDLIHVETFYVMQNIPRTYLPLVLVEHNIEYLVYKRYSQTASSFFRPFLLLDVAKMKYWEQAFWKKATRLVAVSEEEKSIMKNSEVAVVPNGVDLSKFKMKSIPAENKMKEKRVLFIGDFKWIQNRDALKWILEEIWEYIQVEAKEKIKEKVVLWVVGKNVPKALKEKAMGKAVEFEENSKAQAQILFQNADVLFSPTRVGGGTSFKILEAMASGVPVVTTPLGIEGIKAEHGKEVMVGKEAKELASLIVDALSNKNRYKSITSNARSLIEREYDWKSIVKKLEAVYQSALKG